MTLLLKSSLAVAGVLMVASLAQADPITRTTITGRSSAAAVAQGVPLDQTPRPGQAAAPEAAPDGAGAPQAVGAPARPRVVRYGLLGLSWRSE